MSDKDNAEFDRCQNSNNVPSSSSDSNLLHQFLTSSSNGVLEEIGKSFPVIQYF